MSFPQWLLMIVCAYGMGFVAAIPVGATQLEVARRALHGYVSAAVMISLGSITSDLVYGLIAFFALSPFLQDPTVVSVFWLTGGVISAVLGIWIIRSGGEQKSSDVKNIKALNNLRVSYVTGFSLACTNPMMIAWWLLGSQALRDFHVVQRYDVFSTSAFLIAGIAGIFSYQFVLARSIAKARKSFSERTIAKITVVFGYILIGLAALLLVRAGMQLLK